jgi:hypothetical protein
MSKCGIVVAIMTCLGLASCDEAEGDESGVTSPESPSAEREAKPAGKSPKRKKRAPEWTLRVSSQEGGPDFADAEGSTARVTEGSGDAPAQLLLSNISPLHTVHFYIPTEGGKLAPGEYPVESVNVRLADPRRSCGLVDPQGPPSVKVTVTKEEPITGTFRGTIRCDKGGDPYDVDVEGTFEG